MDVFTLAGLAALVSKATSFVKYLRARDVNGAVTQAVTWAAGVGVAFLAGAAALCRNVVVAGVAVTDMDSASKVLLGLSLASIGSVAYDFRVARDASDSAAEPPLVK